MNPTLAARPAGLDVERLRNDFPALHQKVHGRRLAYLDNAATTHKPRAVIDAMLHYYEQDCANVHRGLHALSERATGSFERARERARAFLNAASSREIVFVRGTTEAVNLVAHSFGRPRVGPGDEVLITAMEHHSNLVPWQMLCAEKGARLRAAPITDRGELDCERFAQLLGPRTRLVALTHQSNALGTVNPVRELVALAHRRDIPVLVDGAQAVPHHRVDVRELGADFYCFSGHKMYGPTGVGVLYGREALLSDMAPWQGGGEMIKSVSFEGTVYADVPGRFEAGTPDIAGVIGLGAAIDYLEATGLEAIEAHEQELLEHAIGLLGGVPGLRFVGEARRRSGVLSFVLEGIHPHDIGTILDRQGVAVRAGHHCAQPVMERFQVPATVRASLALYNTREDLDQLVRGLHRVREVFG